MELCALIGIAAAAGPLSWLPAQPASRNQMRFLVCSYAGPNLTAVQEIRGGHLSIGSAGWDCTKQKVASEFKVTFRLAKGEERSAGVAVAFDVADWNRANYLLIPAAVYNGNRFRALGGGYMPEFPPDMFFNPKLPTTISDDPRLAIEPGVASKIELLTGNASTPAVCYFDPAKHRGRIVLFEQRTRFGNNGVFVEENAAQDRLSIVVSAPGVRSRIAEFGGFRASDDAGADWKQGDEVTLRFRVIDFRGEGIPSLLRKFFEVRKALTGPNRPRDLAPMSAMAAAIVPRFKARWDSKGYYLPENSPDFQLGWVSGFMQTPMLAIDDPVEREHICRQLDFVTEKLQGKSGLFFAGITGAGDLRADRPYAGRLPALTRKNADALAYYFKFFDILKAQGHADLIKNEWENAVRRSAEAFAAMWRKYGEFGQYLDPETGEIVVFNSSGGVGVPAGLALAAAYFHEPKFLEVAKAAAKFYFKRDVLGRGMTGGYCGDITQDPDSESSFAFLESLMALYGATKDSAWLSKARDEAALAATWVLSYDHVFPAESQIGKLGCHMAGAVWASAQNKHAAPGICTSSGDSLFKLYRATGDARYAELLRDIQHAQVEATDMPGHATCGTGSGASMERIQPTDAEGKGAVGNFIETQNAWCEMDGLMMATELPGIYVRTDVERLFVFDHVQARIVQRGVDFIILEIANRAAYDASVTLFAEDGRQAREPLSRTAYLKWPSAWIPAGFSARVLLNNAGRADLVSLDRVRSGE